MPATEPPLGPPPRKAMVRRGVQGLQRAYATLFALVIVVFGGWVVLDALRWPSLSVDQRLLTVGFGLIALTAFAVYWFVSNPARRELRLARRGILVQGRITAIGKTRGRRPIPILMYTFYVATGAAFQGSCKVSRRFPIGTLAADMPIEVLYDP